MDSNHRNLGVGQASLPLDHGICSAKQLQAPESNRAAGLMRAGWSPYRLQKYLGSGSNRRNLLLFRQALYQLSYPGEFEITRTQSGGMLTTLGEHGLVSGSSMLTQSGEHATQNPIRNSTSPGGRSRTNILWFRARRSAVELLRRKSSSCFQFGEKDSNLHKQL